MKKKIKGHALFRKQFARTIQFMARRPKAPLPSQPIQSVVILARECYGDCILLTPLIGMLRKEYPELSIYVVAFTRIIFDFFNADPNVTAVYHAKRDLHRYLRGILSREFDILFNPKDHPSTHFLLQSMLIRARYKVSHFSPGHEGIYDHLIALEAHTHESLKNLAFLDTLQVSSSPADCRPYLPPMPVSAEIDTFVNSIPEKRYIGLNISAGHAGGHRRLEQWGDLITGFPHETFIIFSSPKDIDEKRKLEQSCKNILVSPATRNLYEVGEIVRKLKLLLTPDTSLVHIAACYDTALIALYREYLIDRLQFGPLSSIQQVIVSPSPDIADIDTETIAQELENMLQSL
ncbi:MAG: glycosyltransferase family 9 protein [Chlorobiaceae bacterium]|nr:glycosyltransferase family 9 protein [Chlorobiaceae bacterium]